MTDFSIKESNKKIYRCDVTKYDNLPNLLDSNKNNWITYNSHLIINKVKNIEIHLDNRVKGVLECKK